MSKGNVIRLAGKSDTWEKAATWFFRGVDLILLGKGIWKAYRAEKEPEPNQPIVVIWAECETQATLQPAMQDQIDDYLAIVVP